MIIGYDREDWKKFQIKNPVEIVFLHQKNRWICLKKRFQN